MTEPNENASEHNTTGTEPPATCENPEADCHREPVRDVSWAEDYTSDTPRMDLWLCEPCAQILQRGTVIAPNELSLGQPLQSDTNQEDD